MKLIMEKIMDHKTFREKHEEYSHLPLPQDIWETPEWLEWRQHTFECKECSDWSMLKELKQRNYELSDFPCIHIAYHVTETCAEHTNYHDCSRIILSYDERFDEYSIAPRGGKGDDILISYCPWCGIELPFSKRKLWFDTLESLGINFPEDNVPERLMKSKWWITI
jgi:hypothetical protein